MRNVLLTMLALLFAHVASAQCNASFTYTTNGLTVNFTNTSTYSLGTQQYVSKAINFGVGQGTIGFWSTATKTFSAPGTYQVVAYVEVFDSLAMTLACMDTDTQSITVNHVPCSVSFTQSISGNTATFTATNIANTPGLTYSWNFGDGNTGSGQTVSHTYSAPGFYGVVLTASSTSAQCSSTDSAGIVISTPPANKISGYIFADSLSQDTFKVWLIRFDSLTNTLYAVDSMQVTNMITQGAYYQFNNATAAHYRVKAAQLNGPTSGTGYVPTYHTSSLYWNTATVIPHTGGSSLYKHIYMQTGIVTSGPGFVGGNVSQGANKGTANGIEGMLIFLRDDNTDVVKFTYTDANGDYSFDNLPIGTYSIYPENGGYATTPLGLTITSSKTSLNNLNFERSESKKSITPINNAVNDLSKETIFSVSPNPSNGIVSLTWANTADKASITVADITGRKVYHTNVDTKGKTELNLTHLQAGNYFILVQAGAASAVQKITIQK